MIKVDPRTEAILASLKEKGLTSKQIYEAVGGREKAVNAEIARLYDDSKIHVSAWRAGRGRFIEVWRIGAGPDAEPPVPPSLQEIETIIRTMGPIGLNDLSMATNCPSLVITPMIDHLHDGGRIHVASWVVWRKRPVAVYAHGSGTDAPKIEDKVTTEATFDLTRRVRDPLLEAFGVFSGQSRKSPGGRLATG